MKVKTSITLDSDVLEAIDRTEENRSSFLEKAARSYLRQLDRVKREAEDARILARNADRLNREAADVLEYQERPD